MAGERTPLLLRSSSSRNSSSGSSSNSTSYYYPTSKNTSSYSGSRIRSQSGGLAASEASTSNGGNETGSSEDCLFLPMIENIDCDGREDDDGKTDRRGWSGRMKSFFQHQARRAFQTTKSPAPSSSVGASDYLHASRGGPFTPLLAASGAKYSRKLYGHEEEYDGESVQQEEQIPCSCNCVFGTHRDAGIWWNAQDQIGCIMVVAVWFLFGYTVFTVLLLAQHQHMDVESAALYCTVAALALASHAKTALTDPGSVPVTAVPPPQEQQQQHQPYPNAPPSLQLHSMCSVCKSYKPRIAHHCRICNRCISHMDHHCPWMNNCVGVTNFKHFILFLVYTWIGSSMGLILFAVNYFFCSNDGCEFTGLEVHLVRVMSGLCFAALLFVTNMLLNAQYALLTGVGTIDRLQKKAAGQWESATEEPTGLRDVFGNASVCTWWLPIDPDFGEDKERVLGYATSNHAVWQEAPMWQQQQQQRQPFSKTDDYGTPNAGVDHIQRFRNKRQWDGLEPLHI